MIPDGFNQGQLCIYLTKPFNWGGNNDIKYYVWLTKKPKNGMNNYQTQVDTQQTRIQKQTWLFNTV